MNNELEKKIEVIKKKTEPKRNILFNVFKAFFVGGLICLISELIFTIFNNYFSKDVSNSYTILVVITIAGVLTVIGVYDYIGQFAGCGSIIPITGFSNSMVSSAIESQSEGIVLGVINNVFKVCGSVIVTAIISGVTIGLFRYVGGLIFG